MLPQIEVRQLRSWLLGLAGCISVFVAAPAYPRYLNSENRNIEINITQGTGHLFDWSRTDHRIKSIMVDNPEVLTKSLLFNANGCNRTACNNSSMLLVSSRAATKIGYRGTIRVITKDRRNQLHPYTITIKVSRTPQAEHETSFFTDRVANPKTNTVSNPRRNFNNPFLRTLPVNNRNF
jgi:ABC-type uncharacterized transport system involved in gliding motility auxiliary subunit